MDGNIGNFLVVMNFIFCLLNDINDFVWSVIFFIVFFFIGVVYVVVYILGIDEKEYGSYDIFELEELL